MEYRSKSVFGLRCKAKVFQVSNDDAAVAQRWLEDKQLEEKTNTDCLVKEKEKVHLCIKVGANITVTRVPGQEGAKGNVAEKKKVKESMKANLGKLLKYNAWSTSGPSGFEAKVVSGYCYRCLVKGGPQIEVPAQVEVDAYQRFLI
ncbi:hypothetical protein Tco_0813933 [Tanacetum coccineum]